MADPKPLGAAENYDFTKSHFHVLATSFTKLKNDINLRQGWNPIEQQDGLTLGFIGRNKVMLSHTKYAVANPYTMKTKDLPDGDKFLDAFMKELKKAYKDVSKNAITFKKESTDHDVQLYSKITPDTSYVMGGSNGYSSVMAKFLITTKIIYEVSTKLLKDE